MRDSIVKPFFLIITGLISIFGTGLGDAAIPACTSVFPTALNAVSPSSITLSCNTRVTSNPANALGSTSVSSPCASCPTGPCVAGTAAQPISVTFPAFPGTTNVTANLNTIVGSNGVLDYDTITVSSGRTLTFDNKGANTVYTVKSLVMPGSATINFAAPGIYWFNSITGPSAANTTTFAVSGNGLVQIYVNGDLQLQTLSMTDNDMFTYVKGTFNPNLANDLTTTRVRGAAYATSVSLDRIRTNGSLTAVNAYTVSNTAITQAISYVVPPVVIDNKRTPGIVGNICNNYGINNFLISYENNVSSNCATVPVRITARTDNSKIINFNQQINLSTSTGKGNWSLISGLGTFTPGSANTGTATYTYDIEDGGEVAFGLTYTSGADVVTVNAALTAYPAIQDTGTQGNITFSADCNTNQASCASVFPTIFNTTEPDALISMNCNYQVLSTNGSGGSSLATDAYVIYTPSGYTCPGISKCGPSTYCSTHAHSVSYVNVNFPTFSGGPNLNVPTNTTVTAGSGGVTNYGTITINGGVLNFTSLGSSTIYNINNLNIVPTQAAVINFTPGIYWINSTTLNYNSSGAITFNVIGNGTVQLYTNSDFVAPYRININPNGVASQWFMYVKGLLNLSYAQTINGFLYAMGRIPISGTFSGAATSAYGNAGAGSSSIHLGYPSSLGAAAKASYVTPPANFGAGPVCNGSGVSNFLVTYGQNTSSNCVAVPITVTAQNNGSTATTFDQQIILSTSTGKGDWTLITGSGTFIPGASNTGTATYTYSASDNGVAVFGLTYTGGNDVVQANAKLSAYPTITDTGTQGDITFTESALYLTSIPISGTPSTIYGFSNNSIAGVADTMYITAYGLQSPGSCGIITSYIGNKSLKFWSTYINPTTGSNYYSVNGQTIARDENLSVSQTINFTNGGASTPILYRDVGMMQILVKDPTFPSIQGGTFTAYGSTNNFVVRPAKFATTVTGNPGASSATEAVFTTAGTAFTTTVIAQDIDGNTTTNYGLETPAQSVQISSSLVLPAGGDPGVLNNGNAFTKTSPGTFQNTTVSFSEVGIISLITGVNGGSYLGGSNTTSTSGNIGRFTPTNFNVTGNSPSFASACATGGFTYLNQKFTYNTTPNLTVTAQNSSGGTTQNYSGAFFKLTTSSVIPSYATNSVGTTLNSATASFSIADNANGTGTIGFSAGSGFYFPKVNNTSIAPFNAQIALSVNIVDTDGVAYLGNPYGFGNTSSGISFNNGNQFYEGRMIIDNAFGSELLPLTANIKFQYYSAANTWVTNILDSCSTFNNPSNLIITSTNPSLNPSASLGSKTNGVIPITFSSPGAGVVGSLTVQPNISATGANLPHLQYYWPYNTSGGVANGNPMGTFSFGLYPGKPFITYMREIYD